MMQKQPTMRFLAAVVLCVGLTVAIVGVLHGDYSQNVMMGLLFSAAFILAPWLVAAALLFKLHRFLGLFLGAVFMLLLEASAYYITFIHPTSSTSALVYAVKPFYQLLGCLPLGFLLAYIFNFIREKISRKS